MPHLDVVTYTVQFGWANLALFVTMLIIIREATHAQLQVLALTGRTVYLGE